MSLHTFDPHVAAKVGVNAAVIYQNLIFWTQKNMANGRHIHDGHVWTYNSVKAWADMFPYMTRPQVRRALARLIEAEMIAEGNYNKSAYDRTKWYGVSTQIHLSKNTNGFVQKDEPIPDVNTDIKPDSKQEGAIAPAPDETQQAIDVYNSQAESTGWPKVQKITAKRKSAIKARLKDVGGIEGWRMAIEKAASSPMLCGANNRGWIASFDFLTNQSSFTKLMEGNYDQRKSGNGMGGGQSAETHATTRAIAFAGKATRAPSDDCF